MSIKTSIKRIINKFGYDIRTLGGRRNTIGESYALIGGLGFKPRTVIDVGVAAGTPELYSAFPEAYFLLIEPLSAFESHMKRILKQYNGTYVCAAAGATSGEVTFNVHDSHLGGSSIYKESMGVEADGHEITVPLVRIDDVIAEKRLDGPYLIKVDIQGAELEALEGARKTLLASEVVVLEVSLFQFMKGAPEFFDVVSFMKSHDFVAYDIILGWNRPLDNALGQVDIVFVKENGPLRQNHSYSTIQHYQAQFGASE